MSGAIPNRRPGVARDDKRDATEAVVHKYDAFLNLLCAERFAFQRDAVRETLRFLVSDKYPDLERLARGNWNAKPAIQQRMKVWTPISPRCRCATEKRHRFDLATGRGKKFCDVCAGGNRAGGRFGGSRAGSVSVADD